MEADLVRHLRRVIFSTGAFCVAWSWFMLVMTIIHMINDDPPIHKPVGLTPRGTPPHLLVFSWYFAVLGLAAFLKKRLQPEDTGRKCALSAAISFFPSPIFCALLMNYLQKAVAGSNSFFGDLSFAAVNLLTTFAMAVVIFMVPSLPSYTTYELWRELLHRTVGFGLGVAWNALISEALEPKQSQTSEQSQWILQMLLRTFYLFCVATFATVISAQRSAEDGSLKQRFHALLSFAMQTVCAFGLVDWSASLLAAGDVTDRKHLLTAVMCFICVALLLMLFAALSSSMLRAGSEGRYGQLLQLAEMSCALAASVAGSNGVTALADSLALSLNICHWKGPADAYCKYEAFLPLEFGFTLVLTVLIVMGIQHLAEPSANPAEPSANPTESLNPNEVEPAV
eukprot:TRINITY_DN50554_c0_g1_i1.p1 TRINITY_DN50554_c0_g1~~TRINITY_DN50554_c0_g1_i1.p1  ORF type:complete len:397 (-),score=68.16 TRINITY_DN50554_c0_g1_i1:149-1339(-)